jgi:hypothetical protein|nr:MAG TPA: Putative transferase, nesg, ydcK, Structural Genomics.38A [Caudoviricetes sp.]
MSKLILHQTRQEGNGEWHGCRVGDKYELISLNHTHISGRYCIRALKDINAAIPKGTIGGIVDSPEVLSPYGESWIFEDAVAIEGARVLDHAFLSGHALVQGSTVKGSASVIDSIVRGSSTVQGSSMVVNQSVVQRSTIEGMSEINGSDVSGCRVSGVSRAYRGATLIQSTLKDSAQVSCDLVNATVGGEVILDMPRLEINGCTITDTKQFMVLDNPYGNGSCWPVVYQDGKVLFRALGGMTENMAEAVGHIYNLFSPPLDEARRTQRELVVALFEAFYKKADSYLRFVNSNQGYLDEAARKGMVITTD